jgi:hypothetical protein
VNWLRTTRLCGDDHDGTHLTIVVGWLDPRLAREPHRQIDANFVGVDPL